MNRRRFSKAIVGLGAGAAMIKNALPASALAGSKPALHVPAEEEPHELTFMQWPVSRRVHPDPVFLRILQQTIADIANAIAEFEPVILLAHKQQHQKIRRLVSRRVTLWDVPTDDLWCRDSGPLIAFQPNGKRALSHIRFNGWGGKQTHKNDGKIAETLAAELGFDVIPSGLVGEAGGVEHDGAGLLMAHESSWVNENRNPGLTRQEIGNRLMTAYGASSIIWSPGVWGEDITDYHIDSLARFTGPGRAIINLPPQIDRSDPFHRAAQQSQQALLDAGVSVATFYEPARRRIKSFDFVASYANYYVCNGGIIAAQFGDKQYDKEAERLLRAHYPGREIVTLNVDALGEIGGGIHCATQQVPAAHQG